MKKALVMGIFFIILFGCMLYAIDNCHLTTFQILAVSFITGACPVAAAVSFRIYIDSRNHA